MKSALFVDFDNVYSGLRRLDMAYAEAFASQPLRWMEWITHQLQLPLEPDAAVKRRILVRRCYLNPVVYQRFRFGFSRAGFEIVDCPPMTTAGKTSTDIHMVLDIVDVLQSSTRYDEFIVFSADADFTPVLRKLRRDDRRTTMFAAGATSASYDASSDLIIDPEAFISQALGMAEQGHGIGTAPDFEGMMAQAEALTWDVIDKSPNPVPLPALTKILATQVAGLTDSNWAGRGTFTALLRELPLSPLRIDRELNCLLDPRRARPDQSAAVRPRPEAPREPDKPVNDVRRQVEAVLIDEVAASARPVAVARLAHLVRQRCPGIEGDWAGFGTFKRLLDQLNPAGVDISWAHLGGYAFDPQRHSLDFIAQAADMAQDQPEQDERWDTVSPMLQVANFPIMSGIKYRTFLEALSQALVESPYGLATTSRQVRDICQDRDVPMARGDINALLRALLFNGFDPTTDSSAFDDLVVTTCGVVLAACVREGMDLTEEKRQALLGWITCTDPAMDTPATAT